MSQPSLDTLRIFCDVVGQESFSHAAKMNGISQSAASQAVVQLEKYLGMPLIDRSTRPLIPTVAGKAYYDGCRDILEQYHKLEAQVRLCQTENDEHLEIASIYSVVLYDVDRYVRLYTQNHPHGSAHFQYLHPSEVQRRVLEGDADFGLMSFPDPSEELRAITWRVEPMVLVCASGHPFSPDSPVSLAQLNGVDFIAFDDALAIRRVIDAFLDRHNIKVNVVSAFDNIEFIKRGVESMSAVSILPEPTVRTELGIHSLKCVPVHGLDLTRRLCIIHHRRRELPAAARSFIEAMMEEEKMDAGLARVSPPEGAVVG